MIPLRAQDLPGHLRPKAPKRNKYGVSPAEQRRCDDITFDSKAEMQFYIDLKFKAKFRLDGIIRFHRQVIFDLPGGTTYRCDFMVIYADGTIGYIDVKGTRTAAFIRSKKQVKAIYGVEIREVRMR